MAVKQIIQIGDPALKSLNENISILDIEKAKIVLRDLIDTMLESNIIGIAAPQIGADLNIFITEPRETEYRRADQSDKLRVYINPTIIDYSVDKSEIYEGCGSVGADFFGPVVRSKRIVIEAYDENFRKFRLACDGMLARVIQHEYDHLNGIEFVEKISDYKKVMNFKNYQKFVRESKEQVEPSLITEIKCTMLS